MKGHERDGLHAYCTQLEQEEFFQLAKLQSQFFEKSMFCKKSAYDVSDGT